MPTTVAIAASASGANEIVAAVTGRKIRLLAFHLSFSGSVNAKWQSASTDKTGLIYGAAATQVTGRAHEPAPSQVAPPFVLETAAGEALNLNLSGATAVGGWATYDVVAASQ